MKRRTIERDRVTAYYEAGHAVMAFKLGIPIRKKGVTIDAEGDCDGAVFHSGSIRGDPALGIRGRMVTMAERQVMLSLAGLEAQRKYRKTSVRSYHAHSDHQHAIDLLFRFEDSSEGVGLWIKLLLYRTRVIVESPQWWSVIEGLAAVLVEKRQLTGPETIAAIRDIMDRPPLRTCGADFAL